MSSDQNHRLLILGTTSSRRVLEEMELTDAFNEEIYVRNVEDLHGVDTVLRASVRCFAQPPAVLF